MQSPKYTPVSPPPSNDLDSASSGHSSPQYNPSTPVDVYDEPSYDAAAFIRAESPSPSTDASTFPFDAHGYIHLPPLHFDYSHRPRSPSPAPDPFDFSKAPDGSTVLHRVGKPHPTDTPEVVEAVSSADPAAPNVVACAQCIINKVVCSGLDERGVTCDECHSRGIAKDCSFRSTPAFARSLVSQRSSHRNRVRAQANFDALYAALHGVREDFSSTIFECLPS